ncbi:MAG: hypothetical protein EU529_09920 [Promethearchaeota archaeon]|nr:MAG: hypothetical protein EU529_09920 [Candidatus Lokiarchaeota archaeon]
MANNNIFDSDGEETVCYDIGPSGRPRKIHCGGPFIKVNAKIPQLDKILRMSETDAENEELIKDDAEKYQNKEEVEEHIKIPSSLMVNSEMDSLIVNFPNFRASVMTEIKKITNLIECTDNQKKLILMKSEEILDRHILGAKKGEVTIRKNINLKAIASAIIYTVIISNEDMPEIGSTQISNIAGISNDLSRTYNRYFRHLYPRIKEGFHEPSGFVRIRNIISQYIFDLIKDKEIDSLKIAIFIIDNILKSENLPNQLKQEDLNMLHELITLDRENLLKYLTDLVEVIRQLIISSKVYKKIEAYMEIKGIADFLWEKGINFFKSQKGFYRIVLQIFDFLKEQYPDTFPSKMYSKDFPTQDYKKIVSGKLKIYMVKNIYNGIYFKNGNGKCPDCIREGFIINTDISRLEAIELHHFSDVKELDFSAKKIYDIFTKNQSDPHVLEKIIALMESENVRLICRNHHQLLHAKNYNTFQYFINWEKLLSFPAEIIFILAKTCVNNYRETKALSKKHKEQIVLRLIGEIKKKYIIELIYGPYCHTCGEINTIKFLPSFAFAHLNSEMKTINASRLYDKGLTCIEILRILKKERGAYICANCHTVFDYKDFNLFKIIYDNNVDYKTALNDYKRVQEKFTIIQNIVNAKNPLDKSINISEVFEWYIIAIYKMLEANYDVTPKTLGDYMNIHPNTVHEFFKDKEIRTRDFLEQYVQIIDGIPPHPTHYYLTDKGYELVKLIIHFRDYYSIL